MNGLIHAFTYLRTPTQLGKLYFSSGILSSENGVTDSTKLVSFAAAVCHAAPRRHEWMSNPKPGVEPHTKGATPCCA